MSFRTSLFILIAMLLTVLLAAQWLFLRNFQDELSAQIGEAAFNISRDTASIFVFSDSVTTTVPAADPGDARLVHRIRPFDKTIEIRLKNEKQGRYIELDSPEFTYQIPIPREPIEAASAALESRIRWLTLSLLLTGLLIAALFAYGVTRPLRGLRHGAQAIADGDLGYQLPDYNHFWHKDLAPVARTFNAMSRRLKTLVADQQRQQEAEYQHELGQLARGLAHNLRNPLNTLGLAVEELTQARRDDRKRQLTDTARRQIQRIDEWIRAFMLLTTEGVSCRPLDLVALLRELVSEMSETSPAVIEFGPASGPVTVNANALELKTLIQIPLVNALEACAAGDRIRIELSACESRVTLQIADTGKGIHPAIRERLFLPHTTDKASGSGMGLYIVRRLLRSRYEGDIRLLDNEPQGTLALLEFSRQRSLT